MKVSEIGLFIFLDLMTAVALLGFFTVAPGSLTMPLTGIAGEDTALPLGLLMTGGYALCLLSYWKWVHVR